MGKRILVYGGRDYGHVIRTVGRVQDEPPQTQRRIAEYRIIQNALFRLVDTLSGYKSGKDNWLPTDITIISGGATGADSAAIDFAVTHYCQFKVFKADWKKLGKAAGPIRNQQMIDEGEPDLAVEFPGGKGTADMRSRLDKAKIRVLNGLLI